MTMEAQTFGDVFDALADTPAQAADLRGRADLLTAVMRRVGRWDLPRDAAAARLGLAPSRFEEPEDGRLGLFSLGALVDLATAAGLALEIRASDAA